MHELAGPPAAGDGMWPRAGLSLGCLVTALRAHRDALAAGGRIPAALSGALAWAWPSETPPPAGSALAVLRHYAVELLATFRYAALCLACSRSSWLGSFMFALPHVRAPMPGLIGGTDRRRPATLRLLAMTFTCIGHVSGHLSILVLAQAQQSAHPLQCPCCLQGLGGCAAVAVGCTQQSQRSLACGGASQPDQPHGAHLST